MSSERTGTLIPIALVVVGITGGAWLALFLGGGYPADLRRAADIGTAFGPVAAFATVLALVVGFRSLEIQREELGLQREELKLQRQEMADSRAELARTADAQKELAKATRDATAASLLDAQLRMTTELEVDAEGTSMHERVRASDREKYRKIASGYREMRIRILGQIADLLGKQGTSGESVQLAEALRDERKDDADVS